jgi:predicted aspartyl protease
MSPVTVAYDEHRLWGNPNQQDNRPYTEIILRGGNPAQFERVWALIDTGADFLQVLDSLAAKIGIDLTTQGTPKWIQTAGGGSTLVTEVQNVEVEIEGKRIQITCLFGTNQTTLLGRTAVLAAIDVGFDVNGWLLKK